MHIFKARLVEGDIKNENEIEINAIELEELKIVFVSQQKGEISHDE